jgi:peptide/nickel transport system substrate-binding protein
MFTYETIMNPGIDAPALRNFYKNVKEVVKLDERTIKFVFNEIYWKTLEAVGIFDVFPKHIYKFDDPKEFNKHISNPVGSGPYVFEKWDVGNQIVLSRNENYWGKKPKIKKRVFRFITNTTAALQALRSHEIDFLEPTSEQFDDMSKDEEFKKEFNILAFWQPSGGFSFIGWNQKRPFFADRLVRLAMTHIVDRDSILKHILKGRGTVVSGPFYIYGRQNNPDIQPWPYDPKKAAQLLDEAGWIDTDGDGIRDKNGVIFSFKYMYVPSGPGAEAIAKLLKDEASKVGIEVLPDPVEGSIFTERIHNRNFDSMAMGWGGTIESDPYSIYHSSQIEGRGNNFISFSNAEADKVMEQARVELDENKRYALYHQFHKILHEEQPYTFLYTRRTFMFLDKRFENVRIHKLGTDDQEWYVPKDKQRYK